MSPAKQINPKFHNTQNSRAKLIYTYWDLTTMGDNPKTKKIYTKPEIYTQREREREWVLKQLDMRGSYRASPSSSEMLWDSSLCV